MKNVSINPLNNKFTLGAPYNVHVYSARLQYQCIILYGNTILYNNNIHQETAVSTVCCNVVILIIESVLYYRRHDLYAWTAPNKQFGQVK